MHTSSIILVSLIVVLLIAGVAFAINVSGRFASLAAESNVLETKLANRDAEILHLRTHQAHKVDRALYMLAQVRHDRAVTPPPQLIRTPFDTHLVLDAAVVDAIARGHEQGETEFRDLLCEHLARRVVKTATVTEGQRG
jgi:hypothetical protein